jgi:hypothetical protein
MPTLALLHWRIELPPLVGLENAALPSHDELPLHIPKLESEQTLANDHKPVVAATVAGIEAKAHRHIEA